MPQNPIIVALDVESAEEARALVSRLGESIEIYKVGLELYAAAGMEFVRELMDGGKEIFLDLKLYDIPETVKRATAQVARTGVRFLTVHAHGSLMRAAVEGKRGTDLNLLAVTALTSFSKQDLEEDGVACGVTELVEMRVRAAAAAGVEGIVASPLEAAAIRRIVGPDKILVTPGVRSAGKAVGDQKRVATPAEAMRAGATYLVMGRQITRAEDPAEEVARVLEEIASV